MQSQHDNQESGIAREQSVLAMLRALVPNRPLSLVLQEVPEGLYLIPLTKPDKPDNRPSIERR